MAIPDGVLTSGSWQTTEATGEVLEILLIRHGQSVCSGGGQRDIALAEEGERQAAHAGAMLVGYGVDQLYSSPLARALRTAAIIGAALKLTPVVHVELTERTDGVFDGLTESQRRTEYPAAYARMRADPLGAAPGGESYDDVKRRVEQWIRDVVRPERAGVIACVSHGGLLNALLMTLLRLPDSAYPLVHFDNAAVSSVVVRPENPALIRYVNRQR